LSAFSPDTVAKASWQLLSDFNNLFTSISESGNPKMKCLHKRLNQKEQDKRIPEGKFLDLSNCPDPYFIKE